MWSTTKKIFLNFCMVLFVCTFILTTAVIIGLIFYDLYVAYSWVGVLIIPFILCLIIGWMKLVHWFLTKDDIDFS